MTYDSKSNKAYGNYGRRPWDVPDCPECGVEIYVDKKNSGYSDWRCQKCDTMFDLEDKKA